MEWIVLGLFGIDLIIHLTWPRHSIITKCLLIPLLTVYYLLAASQAGLFVLLALTACFMGDLLLALSGRSGYFITGLLFFMGGHFLYAVHLLQSTGFLQNLPVWGCLLVLPYLLYLAWLYVQLRQSMGPMLPCFWIYGPAICGMSFLCLTRVFSYAGPAFWLPLLGSILFIASDTMLALHHFRKPLDHADLKIMSTYGLAQLLLILGLAA